MPLHNFKKWLKKTPIWATIRWCAKTFIHTIPLPICRGLASLPWIGLIASARVFANDPCNHLFTGTPGKVVDLIPGLNAGTTDALKKAGQLLPFTPKERCSIRQHCHIAKGANLTFSGKKVALVAHWDPDKRVDSFVSYYLSAFQKANFMTILTSSAPIHASEEDLIHADAAVYRTCDGYDFTSWKGALECFPSLQLASELVFTNDSVFAPLADIGRVHTVMNTVDCDFWGLMESRDQLPAMPSFYVAFRPKALQHECFKQFWSSVDTTSDKETVVQRFEQSQALWFALHGLVPGAYIHWDMLPSLKGGPAYACWKPLIELFGVPCIKRATIKGDIWWADTTGWQDLIVKSGYPLQHIHDFLARCDRARARSR